MRATIFLVICLYFVKPSTAQITLENIYDSTVYVRTMMFVDSGEQRYIGYNTLSKSVSVFNLDHTLEKTFLIPQSLVSTTSFQVPYVATKLFNTDSKYEYLVHYMYAYKVAIYDENGNTLFSCDSCEPLYSPNGFEGAFKAIFNTSNGTKLLIKSKKSTSETLVYSLPGKLPTSNTKLSVTDAPTIISSSLPSTSAYPNPSNGKIRVAYSLPESVTTGELVITTADGREVKRYRVGSMFNDILVEKSELASGAYFYKLITERGESEARKFVITN